MLQTITFENTGVTAEFNLHFTKYYSGRGHWKIILDASTTFAVDGVRAKKTLTAHTNNAEFIDNINELWEEEGAEAVHECYMEEMWERYFHDLLEDWYEQEVERREAELRELD